MSNIFIASAGVWTPWTPCVPPCGIGVKTRRRMCGASVCEDAPTIENDIFTNRLCTGN